MIVQTLRLKNFRNFSEQVLSFNPNLNIIVGANGQGKTNILEAVYLITEGESFRFCNNHGLIELKQKDAYVGILASNRNLDYKIECRINEKQKGLSLNSKPVSLNKLHEQIGKLSSILFSPESLNVIKDSSEARRHLLDELVSQSKMNGSRVLSDFKKVLRTRNRLLKDISDGKIDDSIGIDTLQSLNPSYLKLATELTYLRIFCLNELKSLIEEKLIQIHGGKKISFGFEYIVSDQIHNNSDREKIEISLENRLSELHIAELKSGVSLVGPQKHDVKFLYNGNDSRIFCSQGQQRSIILAYKMAQTVYHHKVHGFYPLLLLDDVLSELDLEKQESLVSTLNQTDAQTFITTTDISLLSNLSTSKASVYEFKDGKIHC